MRKIITVVLSIVSAMALVKVTELLTSTFDEATTVHVKPEGMTLANQFK